MLERRDFKPEAGYLAVVDLGSNSFHVLLARQDSGEPRIIKRLKFPVQLAAELSRTGAIGATAFAAGRAALERIADRLRGIDKVRVLAVGTAALRRAANAPEFLALAEAVLGVPVEVMAGEDEARMIYRGAVDTLPESSARRLVFDIGGASTELALGRAMEATLAVSLDVGCVTLSRAHFDGGGDSATRFAAAVAEVRDALEPVRADLQAHGWDEVVATSGASEAALQVIQASGVSDTLITRSGVLRLRDHLLQGALPRALPGLPAERVDVFPGGVAVLLAVFEALDLDRALWAEGALQDGLLRQLVPPPLGGLKRRTLDALLRRFAVDRHHGVEVANIAGQLLAAVSGALELRDGDADLLEAAALLHDLGLAVASSDHPRHGLWLLRHAELRGFSEAERLALMALVRGHSGAWPALVLGDVPQAARLPVARLCLLLRLAVLLQPAGIDDLPGFGVHDDRLCITCDDAWRQRHPLLVDQLDAEARALSSRPELPQVVLG